MPCPLSLLLCRADLRALLTSSGKNNIEKEEVKSNFTFALRLSSLKHLKKYFLVCRQILVSLSPTRMSPRGRSQTGVPVLAIPRGVVCGCSQWRPQLQPRAGNPAPSSSSLTTALTAKVNGRCLIPVISQFVFYFLFEVNIYLSIHVNTRVLGFYLTFLVVI